jgi:hypothetical protein
LKGVDGGEPYNGTPREVETKMIVANVDCTKIPIFIDEKVYHIDSVEDGRDQDWFADVSMNLALISNEREITASGLAQFLCQFKFSTHSGGIGKKMTRDIEFGISHESPRNNAGAAIGEQFEIEIFSKSWVQLDSHVHVV